MSDEDSFLDLTYETSENLKERVISLMREKQEADAKAYLLEDQLKEELRSHEQDLEQARKDIDMLTLENLELKETLAFQAVTFSDKELDKQQEVAQVISAKYTELLDAHFKENERNSAYEVLHSNLKDELKLALDQMHQMRRYISVLEKTKNKVLTDYQKIKAENKGLKEQAKKQEAEFTKSINKLKKKEEDTRVQLEEHRNLIKRNKVLEEKLQMILKELQKLETEYNDKDERLKTVRAQKNKLETRVKEQELKIQQLSAELKAHKEKIGEFTNTDGTIQASPVELDAKLTQSEQKLKEIVAKLEPLIIKNKMLENAVFQKDEEIIRLKHVQKTLNNTIILKNREISQIKQMVNFSTLRSSRSQDLLEGTGLSDLKYTSIRQLANYTDMLKSRKSRSISPGSDYSGFNRASLLASRRGKIFLSQSPSPMKSETPAKNLMNISPVAINLDKVYQNEEEEFLVSTSEFHSNLLSTPDKPCVRPKLVNF